MLKGLKSNLVGDQSTLPCIICLNRLNDADSAAFGNDTRENKSLLNLYLGSYANKAIDSRMYTSEVMFFHQLVITDFSVRSERRILFHCFK